MTIISHHRMQIMPPRRRTAATATAGTEHPGRVWVLLIAATGWVALTALALVLALR